MLSPLLFIYVKFVLRLLVFFVEYDVQHNSQYNSAKCSKLNSIDVVPTQEVAKYQYNGGYNNNDET